MLATHLQQFPTYMRNVTEFTTKLPRGVHVLPCAGGGIEVWVVCSNGTLATPPMLLEEGVPYTQAEKAGKMLLDVKDPERPGVRPQLTVMA